MFVRNIALGVVLLCLVSPFVGVPFAEAHSGTEAEERKLKEAEEDRKNAYDERDKWLKEYNRAKEIVEALLGEWTETLLHASNVVLSLRFNTTYEHK